MSIDPDSSIHSGPSIEGMVDDLGRPATIFTPPELLRRDPNRWPTPAEFVSEWEQFTPERRVQMAERILADAQAVEPLRRDVDRAGAEVERLQALGDDLAAALVVSLHDAHPTYGSTSGWRGGPGGAAITTGCSRNDPPPQDEWLRGDYDLLTDPAREWIRSRERQGFDFPAAKASLVERLRARYAVEILGEPAALADPEPTQVQQSDEAKHDVRVTPQGGGFYRARCRCGWQTSGVLSRAEAMGAATHHPQSKDGAS